MANTRHLARRRLLKAAVFQPQQATQVAQAVQVSQIASATVFQPRWATPSNTSDRIGAVRSADPPHQADGPGPADLPGQANPPRDTSPPSQASAPRQVDSARPANLPIRANSSRPPANLYRAVTGHIIDVGPQVIVIGHGGGERRFVLTAQATAWRGGPLEPSALSIGDEAVIRLLPSRPGVADRVWANIGRVTGTIMVCDRDRLIVAEGSTKKLQTVIIPSHARVKIQVRFPTLEPGYLIDIIGIRHSDHLEGLHPATPQPTYRSDLVPKDRQAGGRYPEVLNGSATWHDAANEPYGVLGVSYPAIDPSTGCLEDATAGVAPGEARAYRDLPYLAIGTALNVRNECTGISWTLPVTGCAPIARLFNDRCVACQNSDRGRIADLTLASFVALGGELEAGCFNATLTIGRLHAADRAARDPSTGTGGDAAGGMCGKARARRAAPLGKRRARSERLVPTQAAAMGGDHADYGRVRHGRRADLDRGPTGPRRRCHGRATGDLPDIRGRHVRANRTPKCPT